MLRRLAPVSHLALALALTLGGCAGKSSGADAPRDRQGGEGISFRDGPRAEGARDVFTDVSSDAPRDGVPLDSGGDGDALVGDGAQPETRSADGTVDSAPPDSSVDAPPAKCTLYGDWQCQTQSLIVRCTTSCTVGGVERRITCLTSGTCICLKGGQQLGSCTVPLAPGCNLCSAAFNKPCCSF